MVAIAGGKPKQLGQMEIISYYTAYQREIIVRRTKFDLNAAKERAHIVEGLLIAIKNIDEVIKIIKKSASVSEAKTKLRTRFNLSDRQAQAILDMRLARLVNLEVTKLQEELKELKARIAEYERILSSKKAQLDIVKQEITEIKKRYANPRRSKLQSLPKSKWKRQNKRRQKIRVLWLLSLPLEQSKKCPLKNYSMSQKTLFDNSTLSDVHSKVVNTLIKRCCDVCHQERKYLQSAS